MAKKNMIAREKKRIKLIEKYKNKRYELKKIIKSFEDFDVIMEAQIKLAKLPINSNPIRLTTRCEQCGRCRAVYKKFNLCRICLRKYGMTGNIAGLRKSSW